MDPLHPLLPVTPPSPTRPEYNRVERIERDQERRSSPDWERDSEGEPDGGADRECEDEYDPDWSDPAEAEPYGPDGSRQDAAIPAEDPTRSPRPWDPRIDGERRSRPRDGEPPSDSGAGPHIDITA